jgi:hypothetical protein
MKTQLISEIRKQVKDAGFSKVVTYGGPRDVDTWTPYGETESLKSVSMEVVGNRIIEHNETPHYGNDLILGCWPLEA